MYLEELLDYIKELEPHTEKYYSALIELHKKLSLPFACLAMAILAIPLGIQSQTSRKTAGLSIGLVAFLIYYLLLSFGLVLGEKGTVPPAVGLWMPNVVMGGAGIYLFVKTGRNEEIKLFTFIRKVISMIVQLVSRLRRSELAAET